MFPIMQQRPVGADGSGTAPLDPEEPLDNFSRCHEGILEQLRGFSDLPALVEAANRARQVAAGVLAMFEHGVPSHHGDEESELFPAVVRRARPGAERERAKALVRHLTNEHRHIEDLWRMQRPVVEAVARGKPGELQRAATMELVQAYVAHARFEEREFLPFAREVLGRDEAHLAALGMSLHLRHAPHIAGYI